jgi:hypothetical protein
MSSGPGPIPVFKVDRGRVWHELERTRNTVLVARCGVIAAEVDAEISATGSDALRGLAGCKSCLSTRRPVVRL